MIGKKFTSLIDGRVVEIKDIFEDIIILQDNTKIKASRLLDKNHFEEYIDPKSFFSNQVLLESFTQKIKQIPDEVLTKIKDDEQLPPSKSNPYSNDTFSPAFDDSAVLLSDPEFEKEELMRKYGIKESMNFENPIKEAQKQLDNFKSFLEETKQDYDDKVIEVEAKREPKEVFTQEIQKTEQKILEDPITTMFRNVKRNREFKISLEIENKIPRPDFIEMLEDSYNTSIIDFLADEFTNEILKNPSFIKNKIIKEIKQIVYGDIKDEVDEEIKSIEKPKRTRTTKKKETTND